MYIMYSCNDTSTFIQSGYRPVRLTGLNFPVVRLVAVGAAKATYLHVSTTDLAIDELPMPCGLGRIPG